MNQPLVVVMGVSGAGKSTIGEALAERIGVPFTDGDALHPQGNIDKMHAGHALTDADRAPWLVRVGRALADAEATGLVVACSALKRAYREAILREAPQAVFVHLTASYDVLAARLSRREDHFMPASLLDSQLAALEPLAADEPGITVDVAPDPADVVETAADALRALAS